MSKETKAVADFYARLHPWIDHDRDVLLCHDDGGSGPEATPDLCFYFQHAKEALRIEFKTFYPDMGGIIGCTSKQIRTWSNPSIPGVAPHLWIAIEQPSSFLAWCHDDPVYQQHFASAKPKSKTKKNPDYHVRVPTQTRLSFLGAFLHIMQYARDRQLLP